MKLTQDGFVALFEAVMAQAYEDANIVERKRERGFKVTKADERLQAEARGYIANLKANFAN